MENRGRDILPFLRVAQRLYCEGEDVLLKLHTKKSPHRNDGDRWRRELLGALLPISAAAEIFKRFRDDGGLGMVVAEDHVKPMANFWGANEQNVRRVSRYVGIPEPKPQDVFTSGSMFWSRTAALRSVLDAHLDEEEFETEAAQIDGTFSHAVERIFILAASSQRLRTVTAGPWRAYLRHVNIPG